MKAAAKAESSPKAESSRTVNKMGRLFKSEAERQRLRWRSLTDLKFLSRDIFGYSRINDRVHDPVFDFYGAFDPRTFCISCTTYGPVFADLKEDTQCSKCGAQNWQGQQQRWVEQYTLLDDMHLDPRGTFKSTIKMARCVQAILCFPDITIAYLSAAGNLPESFVNAIQERFLLKKGDAMTSFQEIWPEFCIPASKRRDGEFTTPMRRTINPEPTMQATSIESSLSGKHPWWMIFDDVVDNRNTQNPNVIRKINKSVALSMYLRMKWTLVSLSGTRYSPIDVYGERLKKAKPGTVKTLVRSVWTRKPGKEDKPLEDLTEDDVILLFPEERPFDELAKMRDDDPELFSAQMLNDPLGAQHSIFDPVRVASATVQFDQLPLDGPTFIAWRFPFEDGKFAAAGAVGMLDGFRMAIMDVSRGSWKPSRLAFKVVELAKKWNVHSIQIEETPGARYQEQAIKASAVAQSWKLDIDWKPYVRDGVERSSMVTRMEPLVNSRRLIFSADINCAQTLTDQFVQFGMTDEREIPEAVSSLVDRMPRIEATGPAEIVDAMELYQKLKQADLRNRVYALGEYAHVEDQRPADPAPVPRNHFALDDIMPGLNG